MMYDIIRNKCYLKNGRNKYDLKNIIVYLEDIFNTDAMCFM